MTSQVQELINKIKEEGIQIAEKKASEIETQSQKKAKEIIVQAQEEAQRITAAARQEADKVQQSAQITIQQAARDTLLALRKKIEQTLNTIVLNDVRDILTPEELSGIIGLLVKNFVEKKREGEGVQIVLSPRDLEKLKKGFQTKLQEKLKEPIHLKASEDIKAGFTISFDRGKSSFDFSDESLAEFLSSYLTVEVSSLLKEAIKA